MAHVLKDCNPCEELSKCDQECNQEKAVDATLVTDFSTLNLTKSRTASPSRASKAHRGKYRQSKKVDGGNSKCDGSATGGSGGSDDKDGFSFEFGRFLMEHPDRITFQATTCDGQLVAIKAYDEVAERDVEAARFRQVEGLRGFPRVVRDRLELEWSEAEESRVHAFVLEWVGPADAGGPQFGGPRTAPLPVSGLEQVRKALVAMHRRGVAHGDVREDNMAWDAEAGLAYVLDLSHASVTSSDPYLERMFALQCYTDVFYLDQLLAEARSREALAARLMR
jgi:hypothetical protein